MLHRVLRDGLLSMAAVVLVAGGTVQADDLAEREAAARQLVDLIGASEMANEMMAATTPVMRQQFEAGSHLPPYHIDAIIEILQDEFRASEDELIDGVVTIYVEEFTLQEMQDAIEFYQTPLGRTLLERMPAITQRSFTMGQEWGQRVAMRAMPRVEAYLQELEQQ